LLILFLNPHIHYIQKKKQFHHLKNKKNKIIKNLKK
jgi:hypothetical protein